MTMPSSMQLLDQHRERIPIAQLRPSIPTDSRTILGVIALIWPYSSSNRTFGLLLVEPDFRLRRERGQVHVEFSGPSAKAVAEAGAKIGDHVSLDLAGVEWTKDATTPATPGKGIDWGLRFSQRLLLQLSRNSQEPGVVEIDHPTPTPEPEIPSLTPAFPYSPAGSRSRPDFESSSQVWASPAFLKRSHLPYANYLKKQYDPFLDDDIFETSGRDKKLKLGRKSYQWKFAGNKPSPENEVVASDSGKGDSVSPAHAQQTEDTISPSAIIQSSLTEPNEPLNQNIASEHGDDEVIPDRPPAQILSNNSPQATLDDNDNDHGLDDTLPNGASYKQSSQEAIGGISTETLGDQNSGVEITVDEILEEDVSQILLETKQSTPPDRESLVLDHYTNRSPQHDIDSSKVLDQGNESPELQPETNERNIKDVQLPDTQPGDGFSTCASRISSPHIPTEHMETTSSQESRFSTPERRLSASKSPESLVYLHSTSSGPTSRLQSPTGTVSSDDHFSSVASFSSDYSEDSSHSRRRGPHPDLDYQSDDEFEIASEEDVISIWSDSEVSLEDAHSISSVADENQSPSTAQPTAAVLSGGPRPASGSPSLLNVPSSPSAFLLPSQSAISDNVQKLVPEELERLLPLKDPNAGGVVEPGGDVLDYNRDSFSDPVSIAESSDGSPDGDNITAKDIDERQDNDEQPTVFSKDLEDERHQNNDSAEIEASSQITSPDTISTQIKVDGTRESFGRDGESVTKIYSEWRDQPPQYENQEMEHTKSRGDDDSHKSSIDDQLRQDQPSLHKNQEIEDDISREDDNSRRNSDDAELRQDQPWQYRHQEIGHDIPRGEDDSNKSSENDELPLQQINETQIVHPLTRSTSEIIDLESEEEVGDYDTSASSLIKAGLVHESEKADDFISEDRAAVKHEDDQSGFDRSFVDRSPEKDAVEIFHNVTMTASVIQDNLRDRDSTPYHNREQSTDLLLPTQQSSRLSKERIARGQDPKLKAEIDDSPQSKMSELEDEILGDSDLDPIFRRQLFTPSASQQRSLESEPSAISEKIQQAEHKLPTPRLSQNISAPPLPPATPEHQQKPSLVEKIRALKDQSAKTASARKGIDRSVAASTWFTHKKTSQLTHVSDSEIESERESVQSSNQLPLIPDEPHSSKGLLDSPHPNLATIPENNFITSKPEPSPAGFRTSLAYYAPLSTLSSHFNTITSVLAIIHSSTSLKRSKAGPRDFQQVLSLTDPSSASSSPTTVQIFRAKESAFPVATSGDAILLRNFKVQSFSGRFGLLSTDRSAWAIFRSGEDVQVRGPPVEFGAEERGFARGLWSWWGSTREGKAKSIELKEGKEAVQQPEEKINNGKANVRSNASQQTPKRTHKQRQDQKSDSVQHELRDGTTYTDPDTPRKGTPRKRPDVHELRDGTKYTDNETEGEPVEKRPRGRPPKARKSGAKPTMKLDHKLRDGTTYSDDVEQ